MNLKYFIWQKILSVKLKVIHKLFCFFAKGLVSELTYSHAQSAWGFRGERVRVAGLAACCNYCSKKKKKKPFTGSKAQNELFWNLNVIR